MATKPVKNSKTVITSGYGQRQNPFTRQLEFHPGIDIAVIGNPNCIPIYCTKKGKIAHINYNPLTGGGFGKVVYVKMEDNWYAIYPHLAFVCDDFKLGDLIDEGSFIGIMGSTGKSTGQHLHNEERKGLTAGNSRIPQDIIYLYK